MAIKGKSRNKGKPRSGARAPRPVPVVVKPPFFLRRWVQVSLAFVAGIAAMVAFVWATDGVRQERRNHRVTAQNATARRAVAQWQTTVNTALTDVQFDNQSRAVAVLTNLATLVDGMKKGTVAKGAAASAATAEQSLKTAADALDKLSTDVIRGKGLSEFEATSLIDSRDAMSQAFRTAQEVAGLVQVADGTDAATVKGIAARSATLLTASQTAFSAAYEGFYGVTVAVGLASALPPPPAPPGSAGS
jgi:hypothetical protein